VKKIIAVIGARPQFIKHFPIEQASKDKLELITIHTGQHYDKNMSQVFFDQLRMKKPDYMLSLGGGSHGEQTGKMLIEIEKILLEEKPEAVLVYGDTNSTLAGSLAASKLNLKVIHIEAGLRSYNRLMPEEINRILTDQISSLLLVPNDHALQNLEKENVNNNVFIVGDVMKDMVRIAKTRIGEGRNKNLQEPYYYATLHRPYNVDKKERLQYILDSISELANKVIFAAHPRTLKMIEAFELNLNKSKIEIISPQGYFENLIYLSNAKALITDSGGMQKEAYWLQKKCITIRSETEWTETTHDGANILLFNDLTDIKNHIDSPIMNWNEDLYGDGRSAEKIVELIKAHL